MFLFFISTVGSAEVFFLSDSLGFFFYSVELSATVLQKYSFAFYCLKCMFRMASCLKAFALKHWGSEKAESMLTLLVKVAFNFYSTFHRKLPQNTNCLPAFQEWCMFHDNF